MAHERIDNDYLREFFGIADDAQGRAELAEIRGKLTRLQFDNGQDICTVDGAPDGMFFLESGAAAVLDREGEQINLMHEGQYFGEYAVLSGQPRLSTVRSLGRTVVYRLGSDETMEILRRHPNVYGELMKRVYGQVTHEHTQRIALSRMQRGILRDPGNRAPLSPRRMLAQYGALALVFLLSAALVPPGSAGPVFLLPLALMLAWVLLTRRTVESLAVGGMLAALLALRSGLAVSYTDALMAAMAAPDNVFTVLVMALMGGVVTLIEASGAVTAFKKLVDRRVRTKRGAMLAAVGILAATAIDDCLNMLCAATATRSVADEQRIPREDTALLLSFLPTVLCSFLPFSLWGIFVVGTINASMGARGVVLFCRSIPFNFFSVLTAAAMLLHCFGRLPRTARLRAAAKRAEEGGTLWPEGSERFLIREETEIWGRTVNLLAPVAVLAAASLGARSLRTGSVMLDSACGLVATLVFLFFFYCAQGLMSPETFAEHLIAGIQSMVLPIMLYLMTMCFSALLEQEALGRFFDGAVQLMGPAVWLIPAGLFLASTLLTAALGSSWAMYVIGFPAAIHLAAAAGISPALCVGAVCAAGIAGEKNCAFTSDSMSVGSAIGCDPDAVLAVRLPYGAAFTILSLLCYAAAGLLA